MILPTTTTTNLGIPLTGSAAMEFANWDNEGPRQNEVL
jgi:hypothetical protein